MFPTLRNSDPDAEGVVASWLAEEGTRVHAGDLVAEVRVGQASGQIAASADGILRHVVAGSERVRQGTVIAVLA